MAELGIEPLESTHTDEAAKLERELRKLVEDIPELGEFFGFWTKKAVLQQSDSGPIVADAQEGAQIALPFGNGTSSGNTAPQDIGEELGHALIQNQENGTKKAEPISRTSRQGPKISFASVPDRLDLAWIDGNNVVINSGHPSYTRVRSNATARRLYCFFAISAAVQRFLAASDNSRDLMFIDRFMAAWGSK